MAGLGATLLGGCAPLRSFPFDTGSPVVSDALEIRFFSVVICGVEKKQYVFFFIIAHPF